MSFEYNTYFRSNFLIPVIVVIFCILLLIANIIVLYRIKNISQKQIKSYHILAIIIAIMFLVVYIPLIRNGIHLLYEKEQDAIIECGTIQKIESVSNSPRYYLNGEVYRASWVEIDNQKYYFMIADGLQIGQTVSFKYLPNSRFIMSYQTM